MDNVIDKMPEATYRSCLAQGLLALSGSGDYGERIRRRGRVGWGSQRSCQQETGEADRRKRGRGGRTVERLLAAAGADVFRGRMTMTLAISDPSTGHDTGLYIRIYIETVICMSVYRTNGQQRTGKR